MPQCKGFKANGQQCSRFINEGIYCYQHIDKIKKISRKKVTVKKTKERISNKTTKFTENTRRNSKKKISRHSKVYISPMLTQTITDKPHSTPPVYIPDKTQSTSKVQHPKIYEFKSKIVPKNIQGPTYITYLKGDIGDGVMRKFLLLGDVHKKTNTSCVGDSMTLANFFRFLGESSNNTIDLFVESEYYSPSTSHTSFDKFPDTFLTDLQKDFVSCLSGTKNNCHEPMRIHYSDTRSIGTSDISFTTYMRFFIMRDIVKIRWPDTTEIESAIQISLDSARLGKNKLLSLPTNVREKFENIVLQRVRIALFEFYHNSENRKLFQLFEKVMDGYLTDSRSEDEKVSEFIHIQSQFQMPLILASQFLLDAYFLYRVLKRTSQRISERPQYALRHGETMTKITGYFGSKHVWNIRDILIEFGLKMEFEYGTANFSQIDTEKQCIPFQKIYKSVEDFVS
jgi:hypothetical protein